MLAKKELQEKVDNLIKEMENNNNYNMSFIFLEKNKILGCPNILLI